MDETRRWIPIAPDGWRFIGPLALLTLIAWWFGWFWIGLIPAILTGFAVWFFRDPEREAPAGDRLAVAPADGKIISVDSVDCDRFPGARATRVGIMLTVFNCHINRAAAEGVVRDVRYQRGRFHNALFDKSSEENEHNVVALDTAWGYMEIKQIAGAIARRVVCYCKPGDRLRRGQRIGLIRFGSRTEILLPAGTEIWVKKGDRVRGGASILGRLSDSGKPS
ncbi:MAG: phosphatidylserine decarboxylase family protein [Candidatus Sumerlaeota bacterium]|nr:phosphatidylserine decarboxylase family protein [Candidatus Sumerlaeota bacterium]